MTDPGGTNGYKLQRVHQDQGSENKGEHAEALGDSNIVQTTTHRDWHQGSSAIEGMFGRAQTKAAAIGIGAFGQQQNLMVQSMGTRIKHAIRLMQFKPTTSSQKEEGISPIQEQYHMLSQGEKPKYTYGWYAKSKNKQDEAHRHPLGMGAAGAGSTSVRVYESGRE